MFYECLRCTTRLRPTTTPANEPVLECPRCHRCVARSLAKDAVYACRKVVLAEELPRWVGERVFVPSTAWYNQGRDVGYLVDAETLECSCKHEGKCSHQAKARRFLKELATVSV